GQFRYSLFFGDSGTGTGIPRSGPRHSLGGSLLPIPVPVGNFPRLRVPIRGGTRGDSPTLGNFDTPTKYQTWKDTIGQSNKQ
ncbi:hypothetical protein PIB30_054379, partial [Stylosanthes scabra]|nr:hypothetical protein [Stylosanthes scabra]